LAADRAGNIVGGGIQVLTGTLPRLRAATPHDEKVWELDRYKRTLLLRFPDAPHHLVERWLTYCASLTSRERRELSDDLDNLLAPLHNQLRRDIRALSLVSGVLSLLEIDISTRRTQWNLPADAFADGRVLAHPASNGAKSESRTLTGSSSRHRGSRYATGFLATLRATDLRAMVRVVPHSVAETTAELIALTIPRLVHLIPRLSIQEIHCLRTVENRWQHLRSPICVSVLRELIVFAAARGNR
jgi:hypothetical protein